MRYCLLILLLKLMRRIALVWRMIYMMKFVRIGYTAVLNKHIWIEKSSKSNVWYLVMIQNYICLKPSICIWYQKAMYAKYPVEQKTYLFHRLSQICHKVKQKLSERFCLLLSHIRLEVRVFMQGKWAFNVPWNIIWYFEWISVVFITHHYHKRKLDMPGNFLFWEYYFPISSILPRKW